MPRLLVCSTSQGAPHAAAAATPSAERPEPLVSLTRRGGQAVTHLPPGDEAGAVTASPSISGCGHGGRTEHSPA